MRALTTATTAAAMDTEPAIGIQDSVLKGKGTPRSWASLPEELVRYLGTWCLWIRAPSAYVPSTWDENRLRHQRILYSSLRDAFHLEKTLMCVCPKWGLALEKHTLWQQAISLVDPTDSLAHLAIVSPSTELSPYRHFRQIVSSSCLVCRINNPVTSIGLLTAKYSISSHLFGFISLCREHEHRRLAFCGFCFRESQIFASNPSTGVNEVAVLENEDDETFPAVEATCRSCRSEWLWNKASLAPFDQAAIGGPELCSDDWETRQSVDGFIELAEGSVADVINLAREKYWLKKETRLSDMMQQALAAAKFNSSATATASLRRGAAIDDGTPIEWEEELEDEEEESSGEEDNELMQLEGGVKDLALGDWARTRILDGYWISPADMWYNNSVPGKSLDMPAVHPCPWTIDSSAIGDPSQHPQSRIKSAPIPPSFSLCEQAFIQYGQQLRLILSPAMKNIVRRIAIECALENLENGNQDKVVVDPTLKASRMSLEDVMGVLREEEGVWYEGYDWVERRRNDVERERSEGKRSRARSGDEDDNVECGPTSMSTSGVDSGDSSTSSSIGSNNTSPVLSTTTLRTTPSPPPLSDNDGCDDNTKTKDYALPATEVILNKVLIPVEPVLNPPRVLRSIPHVPITVEHLPQFSLEALKNIWQEACSPLYHCRCRICERAVAAANASVSPVAVQPQYRQPLSSPPSVTLPTVDSPIILQPHYYEQSKRGEVVDSPVHIQLQEVSESEFELAAVVEDGEGAIAEFEIYDEEEVEEEEMYDSEDLDSGSSLAFMPVSGGYSVKRGQTSGFKKRQSEDQFEDEDETDSEGDEGETEDEEGETEDEEGETEDEEEKQDEKEKTKISPHVVATINSQTRKRSFDETEGEEDHSQTRVGSPPKRQRKMGVSIEKISSTASTTGIVSSDVSVPVKGHKYHMEEERVQKKRSSEELADDYGDGYDDHIRGGGDTDKGMLKSWKKKRQRIGIENFGVSEEVSERRRYSKSRSPVYSDD